MEQQLFDIIADLYEAASDGDLVLWQRVFDKIAGQVRSGPGGITSYDAGTETIQTLARNSDPKEVDRYNERYRMQDPFIGRITALEAGKYLSRRQMMPDEEFFKTPIYKGYFRRLNIYDFEYHSLGTYDRVSGALAISRPQSNPDLSPQERDFLNLLMPHLSRAFRLFVRFQGLSRRSEQLGAALDCLPRSIFVLDDESKVIYRNYAAAEMLAAGDGITISETGRLAMTSPRDSKELRSILDSVLHRDRPDDIVNDGVMQITRSSGGRPLQAVITPYVEKQPALTPSNLALMFVHDPDRPIEAVETTLTQMYSLTPAESRLAGMIAQGLSLQEAAELLGVKFDTVRAHLKRVFAKTDTSRQAELMKLILTGPAGLRLWRAPAGLMSAFMIAI